ncbi:hypothetical protein Mag101_07355 [Microbulbifer agarilyticus]|uniref:Uncharacterized protein n=1 Tax=Microbulbifer agarilyticus TaxID=260552 RepID=A0A1Q2M417_9GAMM|nr:hypothetical protein [Microbulbifer agarilyticus]AQQ67475.1 hypothetical protein Mag101_07355 [Microbulbifer agarilyticus]
MSGPHALAVESAKVGPPLVVVGAKYLGLSVDEWIQLLTVLYLLGLVVHQLPKHWQAACSFGRWIKGKVQNENK